MAGDGKGPLEALELEKEQTVRMHTYKQNTEEIIAS